MPENAEYRWPTWAVEEVLEMFDEGTERLGEKYGPGELMSPESVAVDQLWSKPDGKAVIRIGRVWSSDRFCGGGTFVRCHPVRGGKVWFAHVEDFLEHYVPLHNDGDVTP